MSGIISPLEILSSPKLDNEPVNKLLVDEIDRILP